MHTLLKNKMKNSSKNIFEMWYSELETFLYSRIEFKKEWEHSIIDVNM